MSTPGIDSEPVTAWLDENIEEIQGPYDFSLIEGGRSNLTYKVTDRHGRRFVLRRPPLGHVLATAHDMAREHKIISAVGTTDVPVPKTLGLCADDSVNQAPFYVMDFVDGIVLDSPEKGAELSIEQRKAVAFDLVDVLADRTRLTLTLLGLEILLVERAMSNDR